MKSIFDVESEDKVLSVIREVFIIGSKGIPAKYGGFESFVEQLSLRKKSELLHYNIACRRDLSENKQDFFEYNGASCFNVDVPKIGPAGAILYDIKSFQLALSQIRKRNIKNPIIYVLACRMGPFISYFKKQLKKYDGILFVNPDGHEWLRAKWSYPVRRYWKYSEELMVKDADLLICDSLSIEKYIKTDYMKYVPETIYIPYGSDIENSKMTDSSEIVKHWYEEKKVTKNNYFLIVGRFVPENNYEIMISEFMKSTTTKDLIIITNVKKDKFYKYLLKKTKFNQDKRIKFVGTVYNDQLLKYIRENATGYIHGHEVGGTNPSLLEALGSTKVNLLLNVGFNNEVGKSGAYYWSKQPDSLSHLIGRVDCLSDYEITMISSRAKQRIVNQFDWRLIIEEYEKTFLGAS